MRSYRELSLRYIKSKKVRSLWVVIGIIISVALITGVFTLGDSFKNKMITDIEKEAKYHLSLNGVSIEELPEVLKDVNIETAGVEVYHGGIVSDESEEGLRDVVVINSTKGAMDLVVVKNKLSQGRLPESKDEMIVNEKYLNSLGKKIGDKISLQYEEFITNNPITIEKTVVGTTKENMVYNLVDESDIKTGNFTVYIRYKDPKYTLKAIAAMEEKFGCKNIANGQMPERINGYIQETYLTLLGADVGSGTLDLLNNMTIVLVVLVVISSMGLIYNGFMISISERKKEFGLLRAVGMSKRQIRKIVIKEAVLIGAIGITVGVLSGVLGIYILLKVVSNLNVSILGEVVLSVSPMSVALSVIVSIITIVISVAIPIKKASKVSAVQGMKNTFVREENIKFKKRNGLFTRFFGSAGYLANKNLRRNKGRFRAVILGFTLSIFIFVSFSSFASIITSMMDLQNDISGYTMDVRHSSDKNVDLQKFKDIEGVKAVYNEYRFEPTKENTSNTWIGDITIESNKDIFTKNFKEASGMESMRFDFNAVDFEGIEHTNTSNKISKEQFENGVVLQNKCVGIDGNKKTKFDLTNLKVGDKIDLAIEYQYSVGEESKTDKKVLKDIEIVGFIEEGVAVTKQGVEYPTLYLGDNIVNQIEKELGMKKAIAITKIIPEDESYSEAVYNELNDNLNKYEIGYVNSPKESQKEWAKMVLVGEIGVYGFLILVTLITVTNIITSVSSSIDNRRKEIALFRSIGTSQRTIKRMILIENLNYFVYSIIFGSGLGILSSILITYAASGMFGGVYVFPAAPILLSSVLLLVFVLIISKYSIKKLCENSIIEEIREE